MLIYFILSYGAIVAIPFETIIANQEYALASGTNKILGHWGTDLVIAGALLATSSAISGTLFGASRQMSVIAEDGYLPSFLIKRKKNIPIYFYNNYLLELGYSRIRIEVVKLYQSDK